MKLSVFDLDSAICQTSELDKMSLIAALQDVSGVQIESRAIDPSEDFKTIWYRATERVATAVELAELRQRFSFHMRRQFLIRPGQLPANYALVEQINRLQATKNSIVGIVSSNSAAVLIMKAKSIGLNCDTLPLATCDDSDQLEGVLRVMKTRVTRSFGFHFSESLFVGGSNWERATATHGFIHQLPSDYLAENVTGYFDGESLETS